MCQHIHVYSEINHYLNIASSFSDWRVERATESNLVQQDRIFFCWPAAVDEKIMEYELKTSFQSRSKVLDKTKKLILLNGKSR